MATFQDQLIKANKIDSNIVSKELFDFIRAISKELVELNKKQINEDSQDIYGKAIGFYSRATEFLTLGVKKAGEPFTGEDTGSWLSRFYVTVLDNTFFFGSTDPKTDDILDSPYWLSSDLFGLTDENLQMVIDTKFLPFIKEYYRKSLDL
jgi:uncharacterized protein (UPF0335 family)